MSKRSSTPTPSKPASSASQDLSPAESMGVVIKRTSQQSASNNGQSGRAKSPLSGRKVLPSALLANNNSNTVLTNLPPTPKTSATPLSSGKLSSVSRTHNEFESVATPSNLYGSTRKTTPSRRTPSTPAIAITVASGIKVVNSTPSLSQTPLSLNAGRSGGADNGVSEMSDIDYVPNSTSASAAKPRRQSIALKVAGGSNVKVRSNFALSARSSSPYSKSLFKLPTTEESGNIIELFSEMMSFKTNTFGRFVIGSFCSILLLAFLFTPMAQLLNILSPEGSYNEKMKLTFPSLYNNQVAKITLSIIIGLLAFTISYYTYWRSCQRKESFVLRNVFKNIIIKRLEDSKDDVNDFAFVSVDDIRQYCIQAVSSGHINNLLGNEVDSLPSQSLKDFALGLLTEDKVREHWPLFEKDVDENPDIACDLVTSSDYTVKKSWKFTRY